MDTWAHGKVIKIKGFPKDYKVKPLRVAVSTHRTDWVVTNEQAVRTDEESDDRTVHERDGRTFDQQMLEAIRMMAVEPVREGEYAADAIASYGFNRTPRHSSELLRQTGYGARFSVAGSSAQGARRVMQFRKSGGRRSTS